MKSLNKLTKAELRLKYDELLIDRDRLTKLKNTLNTSRDQKNRAFDMIDHLIRDPKMNVPADAAIRIFQIIQDVRHA